MASSCLCASALSLSQPLQGANASIQVSFARSEVAGGAGLRALSGNLSVQRGKHARLAVPVQPLASRVCDLTGKRANNGYKVSFSNHRTKKLQGVNLQYKRLWWEEGNKFVKMRISTKALKTIEKKGLSVMAKEAGIDLNDFAV